MRKGVFESINVYTFVIYHHFFLLMLFIYLLHCVYDSLVEETLKPLDPDRRAFRLVGGVLVSLICGDMIQIIVPKSMVLTERNAVQFVPFIIIYCQIIGGTYCSGGIANCEGRSRKCKTDFV